MSLLVWLPLNGNLNNQGIENVIVTNYGATIDNNGKIGKCYYFDGNGHYLQYNKTLNFYSGDFSYAIWLKPMDDTRSIIFSEYASSGSSDIALELTAARALRLYWAGSPDIYPTNCVLPSNQWSHVVVTRSGNIAKFYINGELRYTYTGTLNNRSSTSKIRMGDDYRGGTSVSYMGYMNDARIYDHCLSAKEIKEISKGLVVHYPLNGGGRAADNMLVYSTVNATNQTLLKNNISTAWNDITLTTKEGYQCYLYPSAQSSTWWYTRTWYHALKANTTYTYSVDLYCTKEHDFSFGSLGHFQVINSNSTASDKTHEDVASARIYEPSRVQANKWTRCRITFTTNNLANSDFAVYPRYNIAANDCDVYFKNCKLEENNIPTHWMPNSTDNEYIYMGYNSIIEYDTSGNNYNGTKSGTLSYISDTPKYSVATTFANNSHIILDIVPSGYANSYTFSWWGKYTNYSSHMMWGFSNGNRLNLYMSGGNFYWNTGDGNSNPFSISAATYGDNKWHHFAVSGDGTTTKLYIDGIFKANAQTYKAITGTNLVFNGWAASGDYNFNGSLSDFRLYATPLSEVDIKELYQMGASITNNGTLFGYEFNE